MTTPTGLQSAETPGERPRLYRSHTNRVFAGVCGGIAEHFGSDPTAVRLAAVILAIVTGIFPMLFAYLIGAIVIPEAAGAGVPWVRPTTGTGAGAGQAALIFGAILILVGVVAFANEWLNVDWNLAWPLILVCLGSLLVLTAVRRH
jgi:phage shock protein C